jgi:hypothetical protein
MLGLKSLAERDGRYIHFDQCKTGAAGGGAPLAWAISGKAQQLLRSLLQDQEGHSEAGAAAKGDAASCREKNAASFMRVKECMKDVNSAECLGTRAEAHAPDT